MIAEALEKKALSTEPVINCSGVTKQFGVIKAVDNLDLVLQKGQILALVGPSGCGKTTLLRLLSGFERIDGGTISIEGAVVDGGGVFIPPERRRVGIVVQEYALFPHMTVGDNVAYGLQRGDGRIRRVQEVLTLVGMVEMAKRYPHQLSGGQQQRVALARALAPMPNVVLLDEPFSNLDAHLRRHLREEIKSILRQTNATAALVTHDIQDALTVGDLVAVMREGHIEQIGPPSELMDRPVNDYVRQFVSGGDDTTEYAVCPHCRLPLYTPAKAGS